MMPEEHVLDDLPFYVFGTLDPAMQEGITLHVAVCSACRAALEDHLRQADALLGVAPAAEPPVGFESRVLASLDPPLRRRPRSLGISKVKAGSAVGALVILAGLLGFSLGHETTLGSPPAKVGSSSPRPLASAALVSNERSTGEIYVYGGTPQWMFMSLRGSTYSGYVMCEVRTSGGGVIDLGRFWITSGRGSWGAAMPVAWRQIVGARLIEPDGATLATATFTA